MGTRTDDIKTLRARTSAGVMDCRNALAEADGDIDRAVAILSERGLAIAAKRADRATKQGLVETYIHGGRIGAMVEVSCETDFVARTDTFHALAHELAMQIASMDPQVISVDELPSDERDRAPERALLAQPFIKDSSKTIQDRISEVIASTGENIQVRRFARFALDG